MTISVWNLKNESFLLMYKLQRASMVSNNIIENPADLKECQDKLRRLTAAMVEIIRDWKGFSEREGALTWLDKEAWQNVGCKFSAAQILDNRFYRGEDFMDRLASNHGDLPRDEEIT